MATAKASTTTLNLVDIPLPSSINIKDDPSELPDNEAFYLQDWLLHTPGVLYQRGPMITGNIGYIPASYTFGVLTTKNPQGVTRVATLQGTLGSGNINVSFLDSVLSNSPILTISAAFQLLNGGVLGLGYQLIQSPCINGGVIFSVVDDPVSPSDLVRSYWKGSVCPAYSTGTIAGTAGTNTITGTGTSWTGASLDSGTFFYAFIGGVEYYLGVVKQVVNTTTLILEQPLLYNLPGGTTYQTRPFRPLGSGTTIRKGLITCSTNSTTVTGSGTKFISGGYAISNFTNTLWNVYRASDAAFVGTISSRQTDTGLTLTSNASISMNNEAYFIKNGQVSAVGNWFGTIARNFGGQWGLITATWAGCQWYGNAVAVGTETLNTNNIASVFPKTQSRLYFSDSHDFEAIDIAPADGDYIEFASISTNNSPIVALIPTFGALIVLTQTEAFAITGTTGANFAPRKIADDGVLNLMAATVWRDAAIWVGNQGVYLYTGGKVTNLIERTIGAPLWKKITTQQNPTIVPHVFCYRDYLFINLRTQTAFSYPYGSGLTVAPPYLGIYLPTGAVGFYSNMPFRNFVKLPSPQNNVDAIGVVNRGAAETGGGHLIDIKALFNPDQGNGDPNLYGNQDFGQTQMQQWLITKAFHMGNPARKKTFRSIVIEASIPFTNLNYWLTCPGVDMTSNHSTVVRSFGPTTGTPPINVDRLKFVQRDRFAVITISGGGSVSVKLYSLGLGFKWLRTTRL